MAYTVCRKSTCKALVKETTGAYCPKHSRPTSNERGYDTEWQALSKALRKQVPYCEWPACTATTDLTVDHIDGRTHNRERTNLRVLCRRHNTTHRNRSNKQLHPR